MNTEYCPKKSQPALPHNPWPPKKDWFFGSRDLDHSQMIKDGVKVIGPNTSDGAINVWHFPDEAYANHFAKILAADTQQTVIIVSLLGIFKPVEPEYVSFKP